MALVAVGTGCDTWHKMTTDSRYYPAMIPYITAGLNEPAMELIGPYSLKLILSSNPQSSSRPQALAPSPTNFSFRELGGQWAWKAREMGGSRRGRWAYQVA